MDSTVRHKGDKRRKRLGLVDVTEREFRRTSRSRRPGPCLTGKDADPTFPFCNVGVWIPPRVRRPVSVSGHNAHAASRYPNAAHGRIGRLLRGGKVDGDRATVSAQVDCKAGVLTGDAG